MVVNLERHREDSPRHHICPTCSFDTESCPELVQHYRDTLCKYVCEGCRDGNGGGYESPEERERHWKLDYVCPTCHKHHQNANSLYQHKLVHLPLEHECFCCTRTFSTIPGMLIHLESGACSSGVSIASVNRQAAKCYQWNWWINDEVFREETMLNREDIKEFFGDDALPFYCSKYHTDFPKLSSLFQHIESPACEQTMADFPIGKLVRWLGNGEWDFD
ncbi:hypothetical protein NA57DRAFT_49675 [Rhizodiscina lignyota]|uniref:C2H2-type domain-containing protein n=1 Tax=Rhizodiscina lignyota TaxID=1504668 RepID=A0A9P4I3I2_9PEZI|nr:hypothetical protein NA57DRAFT_49675 [Rhizodiscina lignyota]